MQPTPFHTTPEIIIDMDKDRNATEVNLTAQKVSARDLVSGYVAAADSIAEAIAMIIKGGEEKIPDARAIVLKLTDKYPLI